MASPGLEGVITIRLKEICGRVPRPIPLWPANEPIEFFIHVQPFHEGKPVGDQITIDHLYTYNEDIDQSIAIDETVTLPLAFKHVNRSTAVLISLHEGIQELPFAATVVYFLKPDGLLQQGGLKLKVYQISKIPRVTPTHSDCPIVGLKFSYAKRYAKLGQLEELLRVYEEGFVDPELFQAQVEPGQIIDLRCQEALFSKSLYMFIDLPLIDQTKPESGGYSVRSLPEACENPRRRFEMLDNVLETKRTDPVERLYKKVIKSNNVDTRKYSPTLRAYNLLGQLISMPLSWKWTPEQKALFWKYRYWLTRIEWALPKFLNIVDWEDRLETSLIEDVLVQWLPPTKTTCIEIMAIGGLLDSGDFDFIWDHYLEEVLESFSEQELKLYIDVLLEYFSRMAQVQHYYPGEEKVPQHVIHKLADFIVLRCIASGELAQLLFWRLRVNSKSLAQRKESTGRKDNIYARLLGSFLQQLARATDGEERLAQMLRQEELCHRMLSVLAEIRTGRLPRPQRVDYLREYLQNPINGLLSFNAIANPLDNATKINGILTDRVLIFKSTAMPVKIPFYTTNYDEFIIIFKEGQDLRQDCFVLGALAVCDRIWKGLDLDLCVTIYRCLALSPSDGVLEYIPSEPLSKILVAYDGSIVAFLEDKNQIVHLEGNFNVIESKSPAQKTAILSSSKLAVNVIENYIRSCAGYSVFTFIFGVGDRHLDNLLLTGDGRLFHIDYSYLFGNDPKPFPPPMKLCREMVEAMGGPGGALFKRFKDYCFRAYSSLRHHSSYLLAFVELTAIGELRPVAQKYLQERLYLDRSEAEAIQIFEKLIDDSITALFPKVIETLHKWAQYWRQ